MTAYFGLLFGGAVALLVIVHVLVDDVIASLVNRGDVVSRRRELDAVILGRRV